MTVKLAAGAPAATVSDRFLSIAVDSAQLVGAPWWSSASDPSIAGDQVKPPYDFTRPRLRRLAAELSPAYLRVGGTAADEVYYDLGPTPAPTPPAPYQYTLTRAEWDGLASFATDLGFEILFTLDAGAGARDANHAWTADNAAQLLAYATSRGDPVAVWELGNEINGFPFVHGLSSKISVDQYAADFAVARALVDQASPGVKLAGPASAFWPLGGELNPVLPGFVAQAGSLVDVITWHYYPQQSVRCPIAELRASPDVVLDPIHLDAVGTWAAQVEAAQKAGAPQAEVWLGETGGAQCGGEPGLSDAFVGSFWWLDQLGTMARRGQPVSVRQSLSGASYGLLDDDTLTPRPDYWSSLAWRRLMGTVVLDAAVEDPKGLLRAYAHCTRGGAPGAVTLLAINLDRSLAAEISAKALAGGQAYVFTAKGISSTVIALNGHELEAGADGTPPALEPVPVTGDTLSLPALSYAFVVLPGAAAPACMQN